MRYADDISDREGRRGQRGVQRARAVHQTGDIDPDEALLLVKQLKKEDAFRWGRVVLNRLLRKGVSGQYRRQFLQELALCTYKDPDGPALQALTAALKILDQADNLEGTDPATVQVLKHTGFKTECLRARLGAAADGQLRMEGKSSSARPP